MLGRFTRPPSNIYRISIFISGPVLLLSPASALSLPTRQYTTPAPRRHTLQARDGQAARPTVAIVSVTAGILLLLFLSGLTWFIARKTRKAKAAEGGIYTNVDPMQSRPRAQGGTSYLDQLSHAPHRDSISSNPRDDSDSQRAPILGGGRSRANTNLTNLITEATRTDLSLDRNHSVRSVATLPAYTTSPNDTEHVIGREGERSGIDIVVAHPETLEEAEERRELEMESLFQIRQARRLERESRRRQRQQERDARARGDHDALRALHAARQVTLNDAASQSSSSLISAHQQMTQLLKPRISSVHYGNIGIARLDGSRLRSDSAGSDQTPLLDPQASMISIPSSVAFPNSVARHSRTGSVTTLSSLQEQEPQILPPGSSAGHNTNYPPSSFARHSVLASMVGSHQISRPSSRRSSDAVQPSSGLQEISINQAAPPPPYEHTPSTNPYQPTGQFSLPLASQEQSKISIDSDSPDKSTAPEGSIGISNTVVSPSAHLAPHVPEILITETTSPLSFFPPSDVFATR